MRMRMPSKGQFLKFLIYASNDGQFKLSRAHIRLNKSKTVILILISGFQRNKKTTVNSPSKIIIMNDKLRAPIIFFYNLNGKPI